VQDNGNAGTVMLGLDGFVLLAVSQRDGEFEQAIEPSRWKRPAGVAGCRPGCMIGDRRGGTADTVSCDTSRCEKWIAPAKPLSY
jgi:hypothetical protein